MYTFAPYTPYNTKNPTINENNPIASVKANPNIAYVNKSDLTDGFLDVELINAANTNPIPIPAPDNPIVDNPAPITFALNNIFSSYFGIYHLLDHTLHMLIKLTIA